MPAFDGPSPSPSTMPPPAGGSKRPRTSNVASTAAGPSRAKRRKPDNSQDMDGRTGNGGGGKGKDEDSAGEAIEYVNKVDFNNLPVETLYKYLQAHDLLPRFDPSPWSEEPCVPPNALYTIPPPSMTAVAEPSPTKEGLNSPPEVTAEAGVPITEQPDITEQGAVPENGEVPNGESVPVEGTNGEDENMDEEPPAPPTTRSKTLPMRKPPTPPPRSPSPLDAKRGVITLSDVEAARAILAEKANAHWGKGLGGGQNKEGETIVNFLYKLKAGPTRLLRVYNPWPAT